MDDPREAGQGGKAVTVTQQGYTNALFLLSLVNLVAGAASVALAVLALRVLRMGNWGEPRQSTVDDPEPGRELLLLRDSRRMLGHETPTEVGTKQRVRRSPLLSAEGRRGYYDS